MSLKSRRGSHNLKFGGQTIPVYGHFGPNTLRTQDISAPKTFRHHVFGAEVSQIFAFVPKCPLDTSAPVPKCLKHFGTKVRETLRTQN